MVRWRVAPFAAYVLWMISACFDASQLSDHSGAGAMITAAQHLISTAAAAIIIVDYSLAAVLTRLGWRN